MSQNHQNHELFLEQGAYSQHPQNANLPPPPPPAWPGEGFAEKSAITANKEPRLCGMKRKMVLILVILLVIAIVVIVVAVTVTMTVNKKSSNASNDAQDSSSNASSSISSAVTTSPTNTPTPSTASSILSSISTTTTTSSSTTSTHASSSPSTASSSKSSSKPSSSSSHTSSPSSSSSSVQLLSANYAGQDITSTANALYSKDNSIVIDTSNLNLTDPWPNVKKCLSILHSIADTRRTFVACEGDGPFTLSAATQQTTNAHVHNVQPQPSATADFQLLSVVWGAEEIRDAAVYSTLLKAQADGARLEWSNTVFGKDTLENWEKSGVVWYSEDGGKTIKTVSGRETDPFGF